LARLIKSHLQAEVREVTQARDAGVTEPESEMRILREWIHRLWSTLGGGRRDDDLEHELRLHAELAAEDARRRGQSPDNAARAARIRTGGMAGAMEALRDQRGLPWIDTLRGDVVFGWRQMNKHRAVSSAAVLSLGLAVGATAAAFRLVDAVLLRPLPVADAHRLFFVATTVVDRQGRPDTDEYFDYPTFRRYSETVGSLGDVMLVGMTARLEASFGAAAEPERVYRQYLSGNVFPSFGIQPALGRLIGPGDDRTPGAHAVAVLSYDYWTRRFARDPRVVGTVFSLGSERYEVIGVAPRGFTGTEPGRVTDVFIPAKMNVQALDSPGWSWFRMWVRPKPEVAANQIEQVLHARFIAERKARVKDLPPDTPQQTIDAFLNERLLLLPAASGASAMQKTFRRPLLILAGLVGLTLLIACGNVANLLIAQAMARAREMALRLSIGAARWRLIQLVLVESALLTLCASVVGALFAWWSAPLVVSMLAPSEDPVRLVLDPDWRALVFGVALSVSVTGLFGLAPAMRASSIRPLGALKEVDDPRSHRRLTGWLIGAQVAFCVFVLFVSVLFGTTFERLSNRPLGFAHERLLLVDIDGRTAQPRSVWAELADHLRQTPGVESVASADWTLLSGNRWTAAVRVQGRPLESASPAFLAVSPGFFEAMRIEMVHGRDFRAGDTPPKLMDKRPVAGFGVVSESFARVYFEGQSPVGKVVDVRVRGELFAPMEIVGLVRDATYSNVREPLRPTVYVPGDSRPARTFIVRTASDPLTLAPAMRGEISRLRPDMRIESIGRHSALVERQMIRERLLATLSVFFAGVAVLLAGVGLYGVLNHAVIRQRREIGLRMALGARGAHVVRRVVFAMFAAVLIGAVAGIAGGLLFGRAVESLLFQVTSTDPATLAMPILTLAAAAVLAALPPAIRAVRIDPAQTLRSE
jgi:putative ABC transport system permease protein